MTRAIRLIIGFIFLITVGLETICCAAQEPDDCCHTIVCSVCTQTILHRDVPILPAAPTSSARCLPTSPLAPETPNLDQPTPPPKPLA
ncbi:MAG: hypothetical protein RMM51_04095 [Verrucomicrobiae bacterium]|nr:hypothetical protein [Verrucomicrobiae bacterium]